MQQHQQNQQEIDLLNSFRLMSLSDKEALLAFAKASVTTKDSRAPSLRLVSTGT